MVTNALSDKNTELILTVKSFYSTGAGLICKFWRKLSHYFCSLDRFNSVRKIVHNYEMVELTKKRE
jgi:hypothetical protein